MYVAQFTGTDHEGHLHGPDSERLQRRVLRDLDGKLASIHAALSARSGTYDLFVCGDHGMGSVWRRVDLLAQVGLADAKPGVDYVVFVNSTLGVLWYLTEKGRKAVETVLPRIPGVHAVD